MTCWIQRSAHGDQQKETHPIEFNQFSSIFQVNITSPLVVSCALFIGFSCQLHSISTIVLTHKKPCGFWRLQFFHLSFKLPITQRIRSRISICSKNQTVSYGILHSIEHFLSICIQTYCPCVVICIGHFFTLHFIGQIDVFSTN